MTFKHFSAAADDENRRLERVLRKFLSDVPLGLIHKSMRSGFIKVNGLKKDASYRLQKGDVLDIADFLTEGRKRVPAYNNEKVEQSSRPGAVYAPFTDVFVNEDIRIINKAYGVPVQGGNKNIVPLDELIRAEYLAAHQNGTHTSLSFKPGPLHRIDRRTTGLVCFSQSLRGARLFSQALAAKRIKKEYLAVLQGKLNRTIEAEHFIERCKDGTAAHIHKKAGGFKTVRVLKTDNVNAAQHNMCCAKKASSRIEPLATGSIPEKHIDCTLARVIIETGRSHQIRAQSAFCGFPLLGDTAYRAVPFSLPDKNEKRKLFLHAAVLIFGDDNPLNIPSRIFCPPPPFFKRFIEKYLPQADISTYT